MLSRGEKIVGLIEQTMPQTGADEDAEEAVDEQWIKDVYRLFLAVFDDGTLIDFLLFEQFPDNEIGQCQTNQPA